MTVKEYLRVHATATAKKQILEKRIESLSASKEALEKRTGAVDEATMYAQQIAKETQEQVKFQLEDIVNLALNAVYGNVYKFALEFELKRGNSEAYLILYKDGERIDDPMNSTGGGVCDILSFALRIAMLIISKNRRILIMDEPFKYVSKDLREQAVEIIKRISTDLGVQIICVTHDEELIEYSDRVFKVRQKGGVSEVTR